MNMCSAPAPYTPPPMITTEPPTFTLTADGSPDLVITLGLHDGILRAEPWPLGPDHDMWIASGVDHWGRWPDRIGWHAYRPDYATTLDGIAAVLDLMTPWAKALVDAVHEMISK